MKVITNVVNLVRSATTITLLFFFDMDIYKISVVLDFTAKLYHFILKQVLLEYLKLKESNQVSKFFRVLTFFRRCVNMHNMYKIS